MRESNMMKRNEIWRMQKFCCRDGVVPEISSGFSLSDPAGVGVGGPIHIQILRLHNNSGSKGTSRFGKPRRRRACNITLLTQYEYQFIVENC